MAQPCTVLQHLTTPQTMRLQSQKSQHSEANDTVLTIWYAAYAYASSWHFTNLCSETMLSYTTASYCDIVPVAASVPCLSQIDSAKSCCGHGTKPPWDSRSFLNLIELRSSVSATLKCCYNLTMPQKPNKNGKSAKQMFMTSKWW